MEIKLTYTEYKAHVLDSETKDLLHQHIITSTGGHRYFHLFAPDGESILYVCFINEATSTGLADVTDYETNYAAGANKDVRGHDFRSEKYNKKFDSTSGNVTHECTDSGWTLFYDINFGDEKKYFSELVYKCDNLEKIRIRVDTEEATLQAVINSLKRVIVDDDGIIMKDIDLSYVNNIATVYIDLNNQRGSRIRILQQRRSGTGDLTAKGYVLSYLERK